MVEFKNKHIRGQRDGTHSRSVIDRVHAGARISAEKYRAARTAKLALVGGDWEATLQPLKDSDLRVYSDPSRLRRRRGRQGTLEDGVMEGLAEIGGEDRRNEGELGELGELGGQGGTGDEGIDLFPEVCKQKDGTGETRCILSWIWITMPIELAEGQNDDLLRSEWAKSRAHAARAMEEILLLREEMRRVLEFLRWKADWWSRRIKSRTTADASLSEGLQAYCMEQSYVQSLLSITFRMLWKTPFKTARMRAWKVMSTTMTMTPTTMMTVMTAIRMAMAMMVELEGGRSWEEQLIVTMTTSKGMGRFLEKLPFWEVSVDDNERRGRW
jgi:hypothetical protein